MNSPRMLHPLRAIAMAAMLPFIQGVQPASAELPMMENPWLGYFTVAEERTFNFLFAAHGEIQIMVRNKEGAPIETYPITLQFLAQETLPDGSVRDLLMKLDTLESTDPPHGQSQENRFPVLRAEQKWTELN